MAQSEFDPASIQKFSVIRVPYCFEGRTEDKMFVVVGHLRGTAICIKATSKVILYKNNPDRMAGCVYYVAGEVDCFSVDTAIQPDNQIPIAHTAISKARNAGRFSIWALPQDFENRLRSAIHSPLLSDRQRERILTLLS